MGTLWTGCLQTESRGDPLKWHKFFADGPLIRLVYMELEPGYASHQRMDKLSSQAIVYTLRARLDLTPTTTMSESKK